jgi:hypothetical protein
MILVNQISYDIKNNPCLITILNCLMLLQPNSNIYIVIIKKIMKYLFLCVLLLFTKHIQATFNVILESNAASNRTSYKFSVSLYADNTNTLTITASTSTSLVFSSQYNNRLTNGIYNCSVDSWGVDPP